MPLPSSERTVYPRNLLQAVVAQVRFPALLRIDSEPPVSFQERVRNRYPLFSVTDTIAFPKELPLDVQNIIRMGFPQQIQKTYVFESADQTWKLTLAKDSLSLGCTKYPSWEIFEHNFEPALSALVQEYAPSFFSRVGLRYSNVISRSRLSLVGKKWRDLLRPHLLAELAAEDIAEDEIVANSHQFVLKLPDEQGNVRVQHGLAITQDGSPPNRQERVYVIDNDFFA